MGGDNDGDDLCYSILTKGRIHDIVPIFSENIGAVGLLLGLFYAANACLTVYWIRKQKANVERGFEGSAKNVLFPIYVPVMWASSFIDIMTAGVIFFVKFDLFDKNSIFKSFIVAFVLSGQHFVIEGVTFLLMQYGCGFQGTRNAAYKAGLWGLITFIVYISLFRRGDQIAIVIFHILWQIILVMSYLILWLTPEHLLFRRESVVLYSKFWALFRILSFVSIGLLLSAKSRNVGGCVFFFGPLLLFSVFKPHIIYQALLADSVWWMGLQQPKAPTDPAWSRMSSISGNGMLMKASLQGPLVGLEVGFNEAQELAQEVDNLRTRGRVKLLNFAYLSLDKSALLGSGSFSKVYRGKYRGTPVAIKLLFTLDLNPELIRRCSQEAQILSDITHPNVVEIFGVSVLPPSVCIVLEICPFGSLSEVIRGSTGSGVTRRPLPLSFADKMYLALGCARGLHALHSHSATLCHRDIKSFNFLVDGQLNAKVADLELGGDTMTAVDKDFDLNVDMNTFRKPLSFNKDDVTAIVQSLNPIVKPNANKRDDIQTTWMAPEVMRGSMYTQESDVYSFGLVLWEVITASIPFFSVKSQSEIKTRVLAGERPPLPAFFVDPRYTLLLSQCWNDQPELRPNMGYVCRVLESCWEGSIHRHIFATSNYLNMAPLREFHQSENKRLEYQLRLTTTNISSFGSRGSMSGPGSVSRSSLSPSALAALSIFKQESGWTNLDSNIDAAHMVIAPESPHLVLEIGKKWTQLTGFFLSDVLARDMDCLIGPQTDKISLRTAIASAASGKSSHLLTSFYRRDASPFLCSIHLFPVFIACVGRAECSHTSGPSVGNAAGGRTKSSSLANASRENMTPKLSEEKVGDRSPSVAGVGECVSNPLNQEEEKSDAYITPEPSSGTQRKTGASSMKSSVVSTIPDFRSVSSQDNQSDFKSVSSVDGVEQSPIHTHETIVPFRLDLASEGEPAVIDQESHRNHLAVGFVVLQCSAIQDLR